MDGVGRRRWRRQLFFENAAEKRGREEYFSSSRNLISQERFFPVRGRGGGDPTVVRDSPNAKKSNVEGVFFYLTGKALNLFHPMGYRNVGESHPCLGGEKERDDVAAVHIEKREGERLGVRNVRSS